MQERIEDVLASALPEIEVLDVELNDPQEKVTVFIDSPDGIGLEHCEAVTHAIRDTCPDHELEVSSPGIERPLRTARHFEQAVGHKVRLRQTGHHRATVATVESVHEDRVVLRNDAGEERVVPFEELVRCKLVVEDPFAAAAARKGGRP